ncbi:Methanol oxidation glmU-like protein [Minicystis rosea]|nr:Methanol oxidation glmU-like protein [Minicystis rosea]
MASANETWKVLPHRPIEELDESLWRVEGDLEGMPLKRVMTVAKHSDGTLVVHNAIALDDASMKRLDAWGKVSTIVVPNAYHRLDAPRFAARYPEARVICPAGGRRKVADVVRVDGTYDDFPADEAVSFVTLDGVAAQEGVMIVKSSSGTTLVFNDAIFNLPHMSGIHGFVFKHVTASTGGPRVSRLMRWAVVKDKVALRAHLLRLAETPALRRAIVSHGAMVTDDPAGMIRTAAATLD